MTTALSAYMSQSLVGRPPRSDYPDLAHFVQSWPGTGIQATGLVEDQ